MSAAATVASRSREEVSVFEERTLSPAALRRAGTRPSRGASAASPSLLAPVCFGSGSAARSRPALVKCGGFGHAAALVGSPGRAIEPRVRMQNAPARRARGQENAPGDRSLGSRCFGWMATQRRPGNRAGTCCRRGRLCALLAQGERVDVVGGRSQRLSNPLGAGCGQSEGVDEHEEDHDAPTHAKRTGENRTYGQRLTRAKCTGESQRDSQPRLVVPSFSLNQIVLPPWIEVRYAKVESLGRCGRVGALHQEARELALAARTSCVRHLEDRNEATRHLSLPVHVLGL